MSKIVKYRLGDVCEVINGKSYSQEELLNYGKYKVLRVGNFFSNSNWYYSDLELPKNKYCNNGDLLFAWSASFGPRIWKGDTSIFHYHIWKLIVLAENLNKEFFYYYLKNITHSMLGSTHGSIMLHLTKSFMEDLVLHVPEKIFTQQKIASVLSCLDSKIEVNNRINAELEAMAKTLYDYWFVQFDFPDKNGKPYKSSGGKMVWNEELKREIPEGWSNGSLLNLGEIIGGSTPPREINEYFTKNGTAWITPKDLSLNTGNKFISKGELDVSKKGIKAASLNVMPKGSILLSSRAPIGYLAISREVVTTNQGFKSFVPNKGFTTEFVYYSVKSMIPTIENNSVGSTFKEVSATTLKSIPICLPPKGIAEMYSKIACEIFKRQDVAELENQKLTELRDWLLPMLMNGQVSVK